MTLQDDPAGRHSRGAPSTLAWRELVIDAAGGLFVPVVIVLLPFHDVVARNVKELLYDPALARVFLIGAVCAWAIGLAILTRFGGRLPARLWLAIPWAVLLLDVIGGIPEERMPLAGQAALDVTVIVAIVVAAVRAPWRGFRAVAAAAGLALMAQAVFTHVLFVRELPPNLVAGSTPLPVRAVPNAPADAPGNVYHILLDNYLSEAFAHLTVHDAATRFPGFTYYSRFNTNFPRTSSSEMALVEGRFPKPGLSLDQWPARALRTGFWLDLADANIGLWLYPYGRFMCPDYSVQCVASTDLHRDAQFSVTRAPTIDLWALRLLPASVRRALAPDRAPADTPGATQFVGFSVTRALASALGRQDGDSGATGNISSLPTQYFNLQTFERLLADEERRPARGQYVYYHALIPHPPYILDDRCQYVPDPIPYDPAYWAFARCANLMIERLAAELSRLGRLDDALIIVHADHGDMEFLLAPKLADRGIEFAIDEQARRYQQPDTTYSDIARFEQLHVGDSAAWRSVAVEVFSSGLLLAKFPRAKTYSEDTSPVQLLDIAPTVLAHFGLPGEGYEGLPFPQVRPGRDTLFYTHNRDFTDGFSKYQLTNEGWQFVSRVPVRR